MNVSGLATIAPPMRQFATSASAPRGAACPLQPVPRRQQIHRVEPDVVPRACVLRTRVA